MRFAELRPDLPTHLFPTSQQNSLTVVDSFKQQKKRKDLSGSGDIQDDEFGDGEFNDEDLVDVGEAASILKRREILLTKL